MRRGQVGHPLGVRVCDKVLVGVSGSSPSLPAESRLDLSRWGTRGATHPVRLPTIRSGNSGYARVWYMSKAISNEGASVGVGTDRLGDRAKVRVEVAHRARNPTEGERGSSRMLVCSAPMTRSIAPAGERLVRS